MTEHLDTLRTRLDGTVRAFHDTVGSYETRVLQTASLPGLPDEAIVEGEDAEKTGA